jgi:hypothetical protein
MNLPSYLFLVTIEHGYLLVRPEDVQAIFPVDPETQIPLVFSSTLDLTQKPLIDSIGNLWIPLEEDCQAPEFIERLADHLHTFPHQLRERIKHYEPNIRTAELALYVHNNNIHEMCRITPISSPCTAPTDNESASPKSPSYAQSTVGQ